MIKAYQKVIMGFVLSLILLSAGCSKNQMDDPQNIINESEIVNDISDDDNAEQKVWFPRPQHMPGPKGVGHVIGTSFIDVDNGWAVVYSENSWYIYQTRNGGELWNKTVTTFNNHTIEPQQISFLDKNSGWILGQYIKDGLPQARIIRTEDGGVTWKEQELENPVEIDEITIETALITKNLWFFDEAEGVLLLQIEHGDSKSKYMYFTSDKGNSWSSPIRSDIMSGQKPAGINGSLSWDLSESGKIIFSKGNTRWISTDGWITWHVEDLRK